MDKGKEQQWLTARRTGLGGSDMPAVLGMCPYGGTPMGVWKAKVGLSDDGFSDTPDTLRGKFLEPIIRDLYQRETGFEVKHQPFAIYRHPTEIWAIGSLDGEVSDPDAGEGILETKAPRLRRFVSLEEYGIPPNYQIQCQHYMAVRGLAWADIVAWNADCFRLLTVRIQRDDDLISIMWERGREFWTRHVLTGIPPDLSAGPVMSLKNLSPTVKRLDSQDWNKAASMWLEAKEIWDDANDYLLKCRERLLILAAQDGSAKIRGAGVSLTVNKNGAVQIRQGKQEILQ